MIGRGYQRALFPDWVIVYGVLVATALVAALGPALRAVRIDPMAALRTA